ncbi:MAG: ankyrin repeat domain-containing protein, partial [Sphingomonadales bacterium]
AGMGQPGVVRFLIEQGAHVNAISKRGRETALLRAVVNNDPVTTAVVLYFGGDPNRGNDLGETPLIQAAKRGNMEIVELLIEAGADSGIGDNTGLTALDYAQRTRNRDVVAALEEAGS